MKTTEWQFILRTSGGVGISQLQLQVRPALLPARQVLPAHQLRQVLALQQAHRQAQVQRQHYKWLNYKHIRHQVA